MSEGQEHKPKHRAHGLGKKRERTDDSAVQFYRVLVSAPDRGFELAEHFLSKQLLFVFRGLPDIELAGALEAMGFDRTDDERMFTLDATGPGRQKAMRLAQRFAGRSQEMER